MIVVLAVATAIGSLKAGGFGGKVMLYQSQASDSWAFYQAKSIKQRIAELVAHSSGRSCGVRRGCWDSHPRHRPGRPPFPCRRRTATGESREGFVTSVTSRPLR
ncbi:MAG TPA: DUF4337 family protein [Polyangia bacterium]|jgi:hypothetical protein